ncbi:nickel pincer cofactor biosynthesis protein LarB [Egicoccus halophilus]|uniref:1-(5-phosphoribosyl)-5-amino-4-imidazole-carboxylate carboxylase n=1 Tax=Egicoccus halophilus TaxID=1670830 RepID=A0A8J3EW34_9ACTN|nr:nickel pincer cofactor biosynthesis protein LarB [Egicoccus halophilus]GGI02560.1 1-(5-phosphoribosyl)-5-amino-4-imidazole-carboxylate carboxylase [Egicoccus halophilus]
MTRAANGPGGGATSVAGGAAAGGAAAGGAAAGVRVDGPQVRADVGRGARTGEPEVVYAAGKTPAQTVTAVTALLDGGVRPVLVSRADPAHTTAVVAAHPDAVVHDDAGMLVLAPLPPRDDAADGRIVVVTAGTSDLGVAGECVVTLEALGERPTLLADVGVAGLHRVLEVRDVLAAAEVVVVVAGMEAALGPVVAGLVSAPVVAVPTSVGYGAAQDGMTALHGLLSACTPGIAVVNVDNGLGAALLARRIVRATDRRTAGG